MDSVYFVCLGARAEVAEKRLAEESDPKEKQRFEKVHEDTHTVTHLDNAIDC